MIRLTNAIDTNKNKNNDTRNSSSRHRRFSGLGLGAPPAATAVAARTTASGHRIIGGVGAVRTTTIPFQTRRRQDLETSLPLTDKDSGKGSSIRSRSNLSLTSSGGSCSSLGGGTIIVQPLIENTHHNIIKTSVAAGRGGFNIKLGHRRWSETTISTSAPQRPPPRESQRGRKRPSTGTEQQQQTLDVYDIESDAFPQAFFKLQRRRLFTAESKREDHISRLPDEMLLRILKWLPKHALGQICSVSTKFSRLVRDDTLWHEIDLLGKILRAENVQVIMKRRPVYLRLSRACIPDDSQFEVSAAQLLYLDLSMAVISPKTLAAFLSKTTNLEKLSLEHLELDEAVLKSMMGFAHSIETINLTMCYISDAKGLCSFLQKCVNLKALNLGCVKQSWTKDEIVEVMGSLPTGMEQLNLAGFRESLLDTHVQVLCSRCPDLFDLDLSDSQVITMLAVESIASLESLQHLSLSRCYAVEPQAYSILAGMKSLKYLELFSLFKESSVETLKNLLPGVQINQFPFSAVGRPTVGGKRSSIWGKRVRN